MQTVLVTGGCGLIGQHICSGLLKKGFAVIAADREEHDYNTGKLNYNFIQCEPTDKNKYAEIFEQNKIDVLIHAACTVDNDLGPIVTDKEINESKQCDKFIYRYAMTENVEKVILLSTDQVYEFPKTREPIREDNDLKPSTNYATLKMNAEKALFGEMQHHKTVMCCIARYSPVYTLNFTDNLMAKITDPKDGTKFVYGKGQYGFQMCCVHNLVDFILCFVKNADDMKYAGVYNVSDKLLTTAADIISFMREHHSLGTVIQKSPGGALSKIKGLFGGGGKEEKTNYRYLDMSKLENNNMLDNTKAAKLTSFRWDIHNTK
ncbi:MAG TPA: NAD(P)-dependent oxidoreductase [Ruminococcus sp.]|nr:NAD(P)-dependent oxidoreductase [Ruminococcus sp.]HBB20571.1 NAD(P)-dependent oxidoreductase [Ruminococcus sp.]HOO07365.1 NAD(P)-dependent oxidoreductase [Ruminococcus sp.]